MGVEDADLLDVGRQLCSNSGGLFRRYLALAFGEDEAKGVGTQLDCEQSIFQVGIGADLGPHGDQNSLA
jgi:hypothetical protein